MQHFSPGPLVTDLLFGYLTLFSIINPFGVAFVFLGITRGLSKEARSKVVRRIGMYSFIVLVVSLFIGNGVMRFFGITLPALRIAGGAVVASSGWTMLMARDEPVEAQGTLRTVNPEEMAFFPLTVPLTTGPGSIAAAIALGANRSGELREVLTSVIASLLVAMLMAGTIVVAYANAATFSRWVGSEGTRVVTRLSAFLLMCVGVQIMLTGVSTVLPRLIELGLRQYYQP